MDRNKHGSNETRNILIICEGKEEYYYFKRLNALKVWSHNFRIDLDPAYGSGNLYNKYLQGLLKPNYALVLIVCDTEMYPYTEYVNLCKRINKRCGSGIASDKVVFFCNPCTLQIVLSHFKTEGKKNQNLTTNDKFENRGIVQYYTGVKDYEPNDTKLNELYLKLTPDNFNLMMEKISNLSTDFQTIPSTNMQQLFIHLTDDIEDSANKWIRDTRKIIYRPPKSI
ncbi:MAG: hypothetical protein LUD50_01930 [Clostridia bacterium]|nr:hypothetical protein [Clostridia bacterium]